MRPDPEFRNNHPHSFVLNGSAERILPVRKVGTDKENGMVLKKPEFFGHEQDVAGPHPKAGILEAKVAEALANDGEVDAVDVQATLTGDDEVTLTGTVCRQEEIARCSEIARSIEGVRSVTNRLTVRAGRG